MDDHTPPDHTPRDESYILARQKAALVALVVLGLLHAWFAWGYTGVFWGEHGRWLHAVERAAAGQMPYRDFQWTHPPLSLWLLGALGRLTGSDLAGISASMVAIYLVDLLVFALLVRRLTREIALPVTLAALPFAAAYAWRVGVPLPLGTTNPTGPVGFALLGLALLGTDGLHRGASARAAGLAGAASGLTILAGHEFWAGALVLVAVGAARLGRGAPLAALLGGAVGVAAAGFAVVGLTAGWSTLPALVSGFGELPYTIALALPTPERLTVEIIALAGFTMIAVSALWLCLAISDGTAARWGGVALVIFLGASAAHMGMSVAIGARLGADGPDQFMTLLEQSMLRAVIRDRPLPQAALGLLDDRLLAHLLPVSLSAILLAFLLLTWRRRQEPALRRRLALLLAVCVAARARSGFAGTDWYHVLLEMPAYALTLRLLAGPAIRQAGRAVLSGYAILIVLGAYAYASHARGPLTLRGGFPHTSTARGDVRWSAADAADYQRADSLLRLADPSALRPLFALGQTGGWNYFLRRENPTPVNRSLFQFAEADRRRIIDEVRRHRPPVLLVTHPFMRQVVPSPASAMAAWEGGIVPSPNVRIDLPLYRSLTAGCARVDRPTDRSPVHVHDCAQATR